jgi:hypothetical protein
VNAQAGSNVKESVYISAIRTKQYNPKTSTTSLIPADNIDPRLRDKFCFLGVKIKAVQEVTDKLDAFSAIVSMTARTRNGSQWSAAKTKTSNAAAVALEVLTSPLHAPSRFSATTGDDSEIDLQSFGKLYEFCANQTVNYAGANTGVELRCNGAVTAAKKKIDLLKEICSTCEAGIYKNEFGVLKAYYDAPQSTPVALINPQRMTAMSVSKDFSRKADGYKIDYINQDNDMFAEDSFRILRNGLVNDDTIEHTYTQAQFVFVTQYAQAAWLARRLQAKEILRPSQTTISVGKEGGHYRINDLIKVQHEKFKIGIGSGEVCGLVVKNNHVAALQTLERFDLLKERDYIVEYTIVNDTKHHIVTKTIVGEGAYTNTLRFKAGFEIPLTETQNIPDKGMIVSVTLNGSKLYLIGGDMAETADGYDIPLIEYNPAVYDTGAIPDYVSSLTLEQPKLTPGAIERAPLTLEHVNAMLNERIEAVQEGVDEFIPANVPSAL